MVIVAGCSKIPTGVTAPRVDPDAAAKRALQLYDQDGDGKISESELENCPSLQYAARKGADADADGSLSSAEIAERIRGWTSGGVNMGFAPLIVLYKGKPVANAYVTMTPEDFLGPEFVRARGITNASGMAIVAHSNKELPEQNRGLGAIYCGFYRLQVETESGNLPEEFSTGETLGVEVAGDYRMTGLLYPLDTKGQPPKSK